MPNVLFINGFRFFFYSNENDEPAHVHITKGNANGKVWLEPNIAIAYMYGFTNAEQKNIMEIIGDNYATLINKWNEYFNQ